MKYVEYSHKWHLGLLWAAQYNPDSHAVEGHAEDGASASAAPEMPPPDAAGGGIERSKIAPAATGPTGLADDARAELSDKIVAEPKNAQTFFSIYFLMTGLHGIHVIGGIGAMLWLLMGVRRGDFATGHFTRVDMVALYWHVVDLIWIYLFLLLYLID